MSVDPDGGSFPEQLAALFQKAGSPSLRLASTATARAGGRVSAQRISDWRTGRHLPRSFEITEPLLVWLTTRALDAGAPADDLLGMDGWRAMWAEAVDGAVGDLARCDPFPGLAPFDASRSETFFGRDDLIAELADAVDRARAAEGPAIVVVTGVSGAGKSSLLGAGVARSDRLPTPARVTVTANGFRPEPASTRGPLVVIDQFESVFSLPEGATERAVAAVEDTARDGRVVVIGVRSDFFDRCVGVESLARAWSDRCVIVTALSDDDLRSIITGPVRAVGGRIESGLPDVLISDVHDAAATPGSSAGQLPLLAHVLAATWERRSGDRMTVDDYRETGGVARALADTAERAWSQIAQAGQEDLARALLIALTVVGPSGIPLRSSLSRVEVAERFPGGIDEVVEVLVGARLVTATADQVLLVHDVILTAWPRLAGWIAQDRAEHLTRQQIDDDAREWIASGCERSFLYRGARLEDAVRHRSSYAARYRLLRSPDADRFVDASSAAERRRRLVTVAAVALVVVLAVVSTVAAAISLRQSSALRTERDAAQRSALLSQIDSVAGYDSPLAARLRLAAVVGHPDDLSVTGPMLDSTTTPLATTATGHTGPVYDVTYSPDGSLMASASGDRTARLWSVVDGRARPLSVLTGFGDYVTSVAFSPTASVVAAASGDGTVGIFDIRDPAAPRRTAVLRPGSGTVYILAYSSDGTQLAAPSDDATITLYATADPFAPAPVSVIRGHTGPVRTVAFAPGRRLLASGGDDATVRLWDTADPARPAPVGAPIGGFPSITHSIAFDPTAARLAVTGDTPDAQLLDVSDPAAPRRIAALPGTTAGSWSVAFDARRPVVASASEDGIVKVWTVAGSGPPVLLWSLQASPGPSALTSSSVAVSPDGATVSAGLSDGTVAQWHLPDTVVDHHDGSITGIATNAAGDLLASVGTDTTLTLASATTRSVLSRTPIDRYINDHPAVAMRPDGRQVATANNNGRRVQLFDTTDPTRPVAAGTIDVATRYTYQVAYSPDGTLLATGDTDRSVALWDVRDPRSPRRVSPSITGPTDLVRDLDISPDGHLLAIASDDKSTRVVDITRPDAPRIVATLTDTTPVRAVAFSPDGRTLYTASRDVSAWRLAGRAPTRTGLVRDVYGVALGTVGDDAVLVGTTTRELRAVVLEADGALRPGPTQATSTSAEVTWYVPPHTPARSLVATGGDRTGSVFLRTLDVDRARAWICSTTDALSPAERSHFLGGDDVPDTC